MQSVCAWKSGLLAVSTSVEQYCALPGVSTCKLRRTRSPLIPVRLFCVKNWRKSIVRAYLSNNDSAHRGLAVIAILRAELLIIVYNLVLIPAFLLISVK